MNNKMNTYRLKYLIFLQAFKIVKICLFLLHTYFLQQQLKYILVNSTSHFTELVFSQLKDILL